MRRAFVVAFVVLTLAACGKKEGHATDAASEEHPTAQIMTAEEQNRRAAEDAADAANAPAEAVPASTADATGAPPAMADAQGPVDVHAAPTPAPKAAPKAAPAPAAHAPAGH